MKTTLLLLSLVLFTLTNPAYTQEVKEYRIMCLGDSITEGSSSHSTYRYPLAEKLTQKGYSVAFVGSRPSPAPFELLKHEGYSGKNAEFLASKFESLFTENTADIILLHTGHNHSSNEKPIPGILSATELIITTARRLNPKVIIFLAQVITSGKQPKYDYIPALNEELSKLAQKLDTKEQPVILVNQAKTFDWKTDTIDDKVHPNRLGAEKMAECWLEAITLYLQPK